MPTRRMNYVTISFSLSLSLSLGRSSDSLVLGVMSLTAQISALNETKELAACLCPSTTPRLSVGLPLQVPSRGSVISKER